MSEDINKTISKYKMYMSFDGNEYEMIQKLELNKIFEEIERLHSIIKEARELLNQEWYSVLRKETITKAREILDKEKV